MPRDGGRLALTPGEKATRDYIERMERHRRERLAAGTALPGDRDADEARDAFWGAALVVCLILAAVVGVVGHYYNEHLDAERSAARQAAWDENRAERIAYKDCLDRNARVADMVGGTAHLPYGPAKEDCSVYH